MTKDYPVAQATPHENTSRERRSGPMRRLLDALLAEIPGTRAFRKRREDKGDGKALEVCLESILEHLRRAAVDGRESTGVETGGSAASPERESMQLAATVAMEARKLAATSEIEEKKLAAILAMEERKLAATGAIEERKLEMESRKLAASVLLEEYRGRALELVSLQNENNRWSAIYISALVVFVGALVNREKPQSVQAFLHDADNGYLILALAILNAIFAFSVAFKGYQVQLLGLYLSDKLRKSLVIVTDQPLTNFEIWRRVTKTTPARIGKPEAIRVCYYLIKGLLPPTVSGAILILYAVHEWGKYPTFSARNVLFYAACAIVLSAFAGTCWTARINRDWIDLCKGAAKDAGLSSKRPVT